jgi:DNA-binding CsgD family transcriptional regulator
LAGFAAVPLPRLSGGPTPRLPSAQLGRRFLRHPGARHVHNRVVAGWGRPLEVGISAREAEVLAAPGEYLTNAEIGARLFISICTVESHVSSLLRKLQAEDRRALAAVARNLRADPAGASAADHGCCHAAVAVDAVGWGGWPSGRRCRLRCGSIAWSRPSDQAGSVRRARP